MSQVVEVRAFGRQAYTELEREHGVTFTHDGYLRLGRNEEDLARFTSSVEIQREFGIDDAVLLTREELAERWPQLISDDLAGGLLGTWDGYVDGFEVCQTLARVVRSRGGVVKTSTEAIGAERVDGRWLIRTASDTYNADIVVNAAGPHAGVVGEMLGAPVPLLPQLHGAITVKLASLQRTTPFVMDYIPGSGVDGVYFRSEGDGHLIAGLHTEEAIGVAADPDAPLRSVTDDVLERIVTLLMDRVHDADELELDRSWQGIYPMTPDHSPIVGRHATAEGVVCALGGGGSGIQLSPAIGRLAANAVRGIEEPEFELASAWAADRFPA